MADSSSFSSLLALVDSHLSKTNVQESRSEDGNNVSNRIPIPSLSGAHNGTLSDTRLSFSPGQRLPIPSFNLSESPIQNILAEQVANMIKAKELKRQQEEEKQRLVEEMRKVKLEEDSGVIDLMQALQHTKDEVPVISSSTSSESLYEPSFVFCEFEEEIPQKVKTPEPILPCTLDMSYILHQRINRGKCSTFGKVLSSRLQPVAAPYLKEKIVSKVVRFDFKSKSPCDLIREKLRKPVCNTAYTPDILNFL